MLKAQQVADYFIAMSNDEDAGEFMTLFRLCKLMYAAQGEFLVNKKKPLFNDSQIECWDHGPVVISVWEKYHDCGFRELPNPQKGSIDFSVYDGAREFLDDIYIIYGQYSSWKLSEILRIDKLCKKYNKITKNYDRTISMQEIQDNFEKTELIHITNSRLCPRR